MLILETKNGTNSEICQSLVLHRYMLNSYHGSALSREFDKNLSMIAVSLKEIL